MAAHHNGPLSSKCHRNHGHTWDIEVRFSFSDDKLDQYGWGVDFSLVKEVIDAFDHHDLNERLKVPPSSENFAKMLYKLLHGATGYKPDYVQVKEGHGNTVRYLD